MNRLADIFFHPKPDGFSGVIEFLISAQQQHLALQTHFPQLANERQSVHHRHADITEHKIRRLFLGNPQCLHAAAGHACNFHPHLLPRQHSVEIVKDRGFIVNQ
ncbi:hypothetical protein D3C75_743340 [compost metagenome]